MALILNLVWVWLVWSHGHMYHAMNGCVATIVLCLAWSANGFIRFTDLRTVRYNELTDPGEALYLTEYIKKGQIKEAQMLSAVGGIGGFKSYSGYFTVNEKYNSNLFFWFFPAQQAPSTAPLLLWLQGGPGAPSVFGLFVENGPIMVNAAGEVLQREVTWNQKYHMLFIDNPVGTGFSFTNSSNGLSRNENEVADNLYSALLQFFTVFSDYKNCDFYLTGESYAGKYVPALGYKIHQMNPMATQKINLVGISLGDPLIDPEHELTSYGELMYQVGIATRSEADFITALSYQAIEYIRQSRFSDALAIFDKMTNGDFWPYPTYFYNITGSNNVMNFCESKESPDMNYFLSFLNKEATRRAIHVGQNVFYNGNTQVEMALLEDVMASVATNFTVLLENYKVLVYNGNLDIIVGTPLTENFLRQLKWSGDVEFLEAEKQMWNVDGELAGYIRRVKRFRQVVVRNAGHLVPYDRPNQAYAMIRDFIDNSM